MSRQCSHLRDLLGGKVDEIDFASQPYFQLGEELDETKRVDDALLPKIEVVVQVGSRNPSLQEFRLETLRDRRFHSLNVVRHASSNATSACRSTLPLALSGRAGTTRIV